MASPKRSTSSTAKAIAAVAEIDGFLKRGWPLVSDLAEAGFDDPAASLASALRRLAKVSRRLHRRVDARDASDAHDGGERERS